MHQSNLNFDLLDPVTVHSGAKKSFSLQSSHSTIVAQVYLDPWLWVII